jgi:purine-binding chemotaxis protein CheW
MTTTLPETAAPILQAQAGKYLSFILGQEAYGIPVLKVREIIRLVNITPIPQMPAFIRGVINLRGKIVPVVDLRMRLNLAAAEATERTCVVVVNAKLPSRATVHMGVIVDGVEEVLNLAAAEIEETPEFGAKLDTEFLIGLAKVKGRVTALLDIDRVLGADTVESAVKAAGK